MHFLSPENTVPAVPSATAYCRNDLRRDSTVPQNDATVPGAEIMIADPFASLFPPQLTASPPRPQFDLYISGRLTLLRAPSGTCGEWLNAPPCPIWHRRLDANAFLWLRSAVRRTIESGKLSPEFADAESRLDWIAETAIEQGTFTADEISQHCTAPEWYAFNAGLPTWADEIDSLFPLKPIDTR